jgi:hypothetical protein
MTPVLNAHTMRASLDDDHAFAEWFVEDVMRQYIPDPYYSVSPEGLREMTINGRSYARKCGISDFDSQAHFVILMWKIGANFWLQPGFREIASNPTIDGPTKIDRFYALPEDQAVHAIMNPDERYWYPEMVGGRA